MKQAEPELLYFDRELSWLAFNERVLAQSYIESVPLLERLNFVAISAKNLDEFYMVRVAGLKNQLIAGIDVVGNNEIPLQDLLVLIRDRSLKLMQNQQVQVKKLAKELKGHNFFIVNSKELSKSDEKWLKSYFIRNLLPVLTPLSVDPAHPFPFIPNMGLAIALELLSKHDKEMKALIPIPSQIPRFIQLPGKTQRFILAEDVIISHINSLFPGFRVHSHGCFRVLRDSEIEFHDESEDFVQYFEVALKQRKRGAVIRLEIDGNMPLKLRKFVGDNLDLELGDVMVIDGILGLHDLEEIVASPRPELRFIPYNERYPERIREFGGNIFAAIAHKDLLVHHPYESFDVVVEFLKHAARDQQVVSIKQTLYRTSNNSPIIAALCEAAENGKSVTVVVEIKARFDEQANLQWAQDLEHAGVMVLYGILGYKTHGKISLVARREERGLQIYTHLGTGNYHPVTARIYDDLSLFTADPQMGEETSKVFNYLTGYAHPKKLKKLSYAPITMRDKIEDLIKEEILYAKKGDPASLWVKINSLADHKIIKLLYEASNAGVSIDLIIRGICCLRPGVRGLSQNIRVKSVVGRFLEHSRIICFGNGHLLPSPHAKVFISSADWMPRNLDWRFETFVPVENQTVKEQILNQIMVAYLKDFAQSWRLEEDGTYQPFGEPGKGFSAHEYFMKHPSLSGRGHATYDGIPKLTLGGNDK
ncbi:MAG: RNA degradosome polyphosphate kinase [Alphaproteobacteria bacterium]|nr:RNA degradosome polyphosphate kinase [Alphaproteobacteria bacterium]